MRFLLLTAVLLSLAVVVSDQPEIRRQDFFVNSDPGVRIHLDRAERGRTELLDTIAAFLKN